MSNFVSGGTAAFVRRFFIGVCVVFAIGMAPGFHQQAEANPYSIAKRYMGLHESKHNGKLRKYLGVNPRRTPWCGAFAGTVAKRAGKRVPKGHLRAANWLRAGKGVSLKNARKGDVVVVRTKYGNHVGFYAGRKNGRVLLIGGNQSNRVKISAYRVGSVRAVRRL